MAQAPIPLSAPLQACKPDDPAALENELESATFVWAALPLRSPKQQRAHAHIVKLEERLGKPPAGSVRQPSG